MDDNDALREQALRVQTSGVLGESRLRRLFDYLVTCSLDGQSPKEIAIAMDVFGRSADFDVSQDALVRVYIHKLRRVLDEFYSARSGESVVLHIPRGEYRMRLAPRDARDSGNGANAAGGGGNAALDVVADGATGRGFGGFGEGNTHSRRRMRSATITLVAIGSLAAAMAVGYLIAWLRPPRSDLDQVRAHPIWSALLKDERPIIIVVGDYYLIGETDNSMEIKRLIREYSVNSKSDLDDYVVQHPEVRDRYMDVGLRYLPTAAAFALRDVMAVLAPANRRITVSTMSDLKAESFKTADIVYIGYVSGLGMLQDLAFTGSRFAVGESFDEIIDKKTGHSYVSQFGTELSSIARISGKETSYRDYGIFTEVRGPGGNTILVISGTRDEGVRQTAEAVTSADKLADFSRPPNAAPPVEALLEVRAFDGVNMSGKIVVQSTRGAAAAP
jgi:hypothetical protein